MTESLSHCWSCGFSPVRHEVQLNKAIKIFSYSCPNWECYASTGSPENKAWRLSRQEAADYWNTKNKK